MNINGNSCIQFMLTDIMGVSIYETNNISVYKIEPEYYKVRYLFWDICEIRKQIKISMNE